MKTQKTDAVFVDASISSEPKEDFSTIDIEHTCKLLITDLTTGLSSNEAEERLKKYGKNELKENKQVHPAIIFLKQFNNIVIYILLIAVGFSLFHHEYADAAIIFIVIFLNAIIGASQELKAEAALRALKDLSSPTALVRRNGLLAEIAASELVTGDIVILEAGRVIPADLRLVITANLKAEESALTGESVPVDKDAYFIADANLSMADQKNMVFSSTSITYGRGEGVVVATGMNTQIGKIASILNQTKNSLTPLQKRLSDLGKILGLATIIICISVFLLGLFQGRDTVSMMLMAMSLAVAAVPESLPVVVTIVLAIGVRKLVRVNTIVRRLPSVETLGAVTIVCSDKTGTLTQNKMTVERVFLNEQILSIKDVESVRAKDFLRGFILCNDATLTENTRFGDPTELALLDMGLHFTLLRNELENRFPRIAERSFDSERKLMTTVHQVEEKTIAYTKGAMDNILQRSVNILINDEVRPITQNDKNKIIDAATNMAQDALRVLGLGYVENDIEAKEENLTFVGLVGMIDPPRPEAKDSVNLLSEAGIRTVMITGDHMETAFAIAKQIGIAYDKDQIMTGKQIDGMNLEQLSKKVENVRVFARVSPQHKVMIVQAFQSHGYVVSMTGDGVNDAPSLKVADIGVAMGITGTDVSKEAADMVLTDDNFATISKAVEEGRNIYNNIKKFIYFTLSSNLGEVLTIFIAIAIGFATPLRAIHILWVNLITDCLPGLALGMDTGDKNIMKNKPRKPTESLFANGGIVFTVLYGLIVAFITLIAFLIVPIQQVGWNIKDIIHFLDIESNLKIAQTLAFITLATSQLFHAIGMRNTNRSIFKINHLENKAMIIAFFAGFFLQVAVTNIPILISWFGTAQLSFVHWLYVIGLSIVPLICHELIVLYQWFKLKRN